MNQAVAKKGDTIEAMDVHIEAGQAGEKPALHKFSGPLDQELSSNVYIMSRPAAVQGSRATNSPPHLPSPGATFKSLPLNQGTVLEGSATVFINSKPVARNGDAAQTCNDAALISGREEGRIVARGTVYVGR
jgi:uncharacterized Zn-binding protein involved in type VI secretion